MSKEYKTQLIELFTFARSRIIQSMALRDCPHSGFFHSVDSQCINCHQGMECVWMNHNDELVSLEAKSVAELEQQLLVAVDFVDAQLSPHHLSRRQCQCENCQWLRKVNQVLTQH